MRSPCRAPTERGRHPALALALGGAVLLTLAAMSACQPRPLARAPIVVASDDSSEQVLLAQIVLVALKDDGYPVEAKLRLNGPDAVRAALLARNVDLTWAYTGDLWRHTLAHDLPITDAQELYMRVRQEELVRGITWLSPAPSRARVGVIILAEAAERLDLQTIADLTAYLRTGSADATLCVAQPLLDNPDGLVGLQRIYGLDISMGRVRGVAVGEGAAAVLERVCFAALDRGADRAAADRALRVLADNRVAFHASDLVVGVRSPVLLEHPTLEKRLRDVSQAITEEALAQMLRDVARGAKPEKVAQSFLTARHLIGRMRATPTPGLPTLTPEPALGPSPTPRPSPAWQMTPTPTP